MRRCRGSPRRSCCRAGHDRMPGTGGSRVGKRARVLQQAVAQYEHWDVEDQERLSNDMPLFVTR
jgi:hypothetical protein